MQSIRVHSPALLLISAPQIWPASVMSKLDAAHDPPHFPFFFFCFFFCFFFVFVFFLAFPLLAQFVISTNTHMAQTCFVLDGYSHHHHHHHHKSAMEKKVNSQQRERSFPRLPALIVGEEIILFLFTPSIARVWRGRLALDIARA